MKRFFDPPKKNPSDARPQHFAKLKARRKNWLTAHLWLGLDLGLFCGFLGLRAAFWYFMPKSTNG